MWMYCRWWMCVHGMYMHCRWWPAVQDCWHVHEEPMMVFKMKFLRQKKWPELVINWWSAINLHVVSTLAHTALLSFLYYYQVVDTVQRRTTQITKCFFLFDLNQEQRSEKVQIFLKFTGMSDYLHAEHCRVSHFRSLDYLHQHVYIVHRFQSSVTPSTTDNSNWKESISAMYVGAKILSRCRPTYFSTFRKGCICTVRICTDVLYLGRLSMCMFPCAFSRAERIVLVLPFSRNAFPLAGTLPTCGNTARWATYPHACCSYQCSNVHNLQLAKTVKMPSNDQANSLIPRTRFRAHGMFCFFFLRKSVRGKPALSSPHTYLPIFSLYFCSSAVACCTFVKLFSVHI